MHARRFAPILSLAIPACLSRPDPPAASSSAAATVDPTAELLPPAASGAASLATRVRLRAAGASAADALFVEGELGARALADVARGTPSSAVEASRVPALAWVDPDDASSVWLAPTAWLAPGATYTAALPSAGFAATFAVRTTDDAIDAARAWPPAGVATATPDLAIWCAAAPLPDLDVRVALDPGVRAGALVRGVGAPFDVPRCARWSSDAPATDGAPRVPPPFVALDDRALRLEPLPIGGDASAPAVARIGCASGEVAFGPGCLHVDDDRATLRTPPEPLFWAIGTDDRVLVRATRGERVVVRGLAPSSRVRVRAFALDLAGRAADAAIDAVAPAPHPHVVVNEIYAYPRGARPDEVWIELLNDGGVAAELSGWQLELNGFPVALPDGATLGAHAFGLVTMGTYAPDDGVDPAPPADTALFVVDAFGARGLSTTMQAAALRDADGALVSSMVWTARAHRGVSVGRVWPDAPDDDPASFSEDAAGGATPGAPNRAP